MLKEINVNNMSNFFVLMNTLTAEAHLFTTVFIESEFTYFIDGRESIVFLYVICLALWPALICFLGFLLQLIGYLETMRSITIALAEGARIENWCV